MKKRKKMTTINGYRIKISRFNPDVDNSPTFKEYVVPHIDRGTFLDALQYIYEEMDSTLLFNYGCRYKVCGKCGIKINGRPSLACDTPLDNGMVLEPLDNFPVIRDLAVDRSGLIEPLKKHNIVISPVKEPEVAIQPPEFFQLIKCNECLLCLSNCPVFDKNVGYAGPFFGVKLAELYYDVRDNKRRLDELNSLLDKCILCKQCDVDCPWNIDFSQISTKIKAELYRERKLPIRDWLISRPRLIGFFSLFLFSFFNILTKNKPFRKALDCLMKIEEKAPLPEYHPIRIRGQEKKEQKFQRKVAYFIGCYEKFNNTTTARDSLFVLDVNKIEVKVLDLGCCGLPFIGIGDLDSAKRRAVAICKEIKKLFTEGYEIIISCSSCATMIKIEYPKLFHLLVEDGAQNRVFDIGDYLWQLHNSDQFNIKFKEIKREIGYHLSCHLKALKIGKPFVDLLRLIPELEVTAIFNQCCGMAGTMGFKKEKYDLSQKIGSPLIDEIEGSGLDLILSDCPSCQMKIKYGAKVNSFHPISVLRGAMQESEVNRKNRLLGS